MSDTIYTEVTGTTCYVDGERGTVTGLHRELGRVVAAFVKSDERDAHLFVTLGAKVTACTCGTKVGHHRQCNVTTGRAVHHEVTGARVIDREEFDRITTLDVLRRDLGWVA